MIEIFKTNVDQLHHAAMLVDQLHEFFPDYVANFDLWDCDRILRIKSQACDIQASLVIALMNRFGFHAEVLPD